MRVPTRRRSDRAVEMFAAAQGLEDPDAGAVGDGVGEGAAVFDRAAIHEDVDVLAEAPALVADVEGEAGGELLDFADHFGHGVARHVQVTALQGWEEGEEVPSQLDASHALVTLRRRAGGGGLRRRVLSCSAQVRRTIC